ncbi:ankyrin repeat domain-containing protein SOWAHB [Sorex araneus]|uniref:ankyrin repeat domain-containing protein SOWAHB n=1 Tax=Sorex araneus TaxID=42254 RepID=UPI0024338E4D|nr:ankyrin repeat domain-containing protein SOWAHB [Sorex araneus]
MARELSQEALLDFLCQAGGRVTNAALLGHFKRFLRDPDAPPSQHQRRRELFKGFVNSVAAVRQDPDGTKYVVLKRRYRDLLGEEGLQPAGDPPPAAAPRPGQPRPPQQPRRRRRHPEPKEESSGADAGGPGPREVARRGGGGSSRQPVPLGAAEQTRGRRGREYVQNGLGEPPGAPAAAGAHPRPREDARAPTPPGPAAPRSPPTTVETASGPASPPAPLSRPASPAEPPELLSGGSPRRSTLQQQQQRTREWVARHPQLPRASEQGPTRAWCVLPATFPGLSPELDLGLPPLSAAAAPPDPPLASHPFVPAAPGSWPGNSPVPIFRSIRCQLSLQDLEDFVDQESHSSEESSSGPKESPGGSEEGLQVAPSPSEWRKLRNPVGDRSPLDRTPQDLGSRQEGPLSQQVSAGANGHAGHPQEPLPWPAPPRFRRSLRRSSRARRARLSSSDEERLEEDVLRRSRRPPRSRKPSRAGAASSPRVDAALTLRPADSKALVAAERGGPADPWATAWKRPAAPAPSRPVEHKSSLVPLDAREHEWIVKLASGSWVQVLALFFQEPQLALHRDFLTGFTVLHWIAKHGNLEALQDLVLAAKKTGITLDVNVKSTCGYTPLHLAAIHGHHGVIRMLVQRLASRVHVRDSSGKKPWQYLSSNTSGEVWQLLGGPRGKPIFPVYPLVRSSSPTRKARSQEIARNVTRKTSLAALLKSQHHKWKMANQHEKFPTLREREEYSD